MSSNTRKTHHAALACAVLATALGAFVAGRASVERAGSPAEPATQAALDARDESAAPPSADVPEVAQTSLVALPGLAVESEDPRESREVLGAGRFNPARLRGVSVAALGQAMRRRLRERRDSRPRRREIPERPLTTLARACVADHTEAEREDATLDYELRQDFSAEGISEVIVWAPNTRGVRIARTDAPRVEIRGVVVGDVMGPAPATDRWPWYLHFDAFVDGGTLYLDAAGEGSVAHHIRAIRRVKLRVPAGVEVRWAPSRVGPERPAPRH